MLYFYSHIHTQKLVDALLYSSLICPAVSFFLQHYVLYYWYVAVLMMLMVCGIISWLQLVQVDTLVRGTATLRTKKMTVAGVSLFIGTELVIFFILFWVTYDRLALTYPTPYTQNVFGLPQFGLLLLMLSCLYINTYVYCKEKKQYTSAIKFYFLGISTGFCFFIIQLVEYTQTLFMLSDNIWTNLFFLVTGLHGTHVLLGIILLLSIECM